MLKPRWTLAELLGPNLVYSTATSIAAPGLRAALGRPRLELGTGSGLPIAGGIRIICARSASGERARALLEESGFELPPLIPFGTADEYRAVLTDLMRDSMRVAFQYVHSADEFPGDRYSVPRHVLVWLNDKANLGKLVPRANLPERTVIEPAALSPDHPSLRRLPVVLKESAEEPSGAGTGVRICRGPAQLAAALDAFAGCPRIVVERYLEIERSVCVQYAVAPEGRVIELGAADQVVDELGGYHGNWLDARDRVDPEILALGRTILARGAARGFCGVAGFDVAVCTDGSIMALDLNFRNCGSTAALLLQDSIADRFDAPVIRTRVFLVHNPDGFAVALDALRRGWLVPLGWWEPPRPDAEPPRLAGLVIGSSRADVETRIAALAERGLV